MPQIWLKRRLYDGLIKKGINATDKVDELVEDFLGLSEKEENGSGSAELVEDISEGVVEKEKGDKEENEDAISKGKKLMGLIKKRGKR